MLGPATGVGVGAMPFGYCAYRFPLNYRICAWHVSSRQVSSRAPISVAHCAATISRINAMFSATAYIPANWPILIPLAQIPPKKIQYSILIFLAGVGVHVEVASAGNNP